VATVRLADLLAGLSRVADLGFGLEAGESLRSGALAVLLARSLDLDDDDVRAALYTALLLYMGCIGYAHETAAFAGDEFTWSVASERTDLAHTRDIFTTFLPQVTRGRSPGDQARLVLRTLARGRAFGQAYATAACEVGRDAARRLRLPAEVQRSVYHSHEWWNGKGVPDGLAGEEIPLGTRVAALTATAVMFDAAAGPQAAAQVVRQRAGGLLDPHLADHFDKHAAALLTEVAATDPRALVADAEPPPVVTVPDARLVEVARVFGDIADVKTPHTYGHARGVGALARDAGELLGLGTGEVDDLELAALVHDVGRVAVSSAVWSKPGALSTSEWEQVRLHAYHSERILAGSRRLAPLGAMVGAHHERCDGSGYHRGSTSADLTVPARILAAADVYQAMTQPRPHRPAFAPEQIERQLLDDVSAGLLDADAMAAVLAAAGSDATVPRPEPPAGLTDREVEVLALVAEGLSNPQIAEVLVISRRTAEHHVQHIYSKIGASSRAAAALFAMEHGLLGPGGPADG
jgi:HD-GYP domain-containing protein (c-di-GMP phosphodiesterase class II)/DNA-binding CsgD family transcriptional regulator